ncbi:hypothetical protein J6590_011678 [Homalodisca vitripennis]|nr:hypothetical protein J6590_011678 [Homalodisca vitripennis]
MNHCCVVVNRQLARSWTVVFVDKSDWWLASQARPYMLAMNINMNMNLEWDTPRTLVPFADFVE